MRERERIPEPDGSEILARQGTGHNVVVHSGTRGVWLTGAASQHGQLGDWDCNPVSIGKLGKNNWRVSVSVAWNQIRG
jgi:hypothetical protein